jgi:hypothetical protein
MEGKRQDKDGLSSGFADSPWLFISAILCEISAPPCLDFTFKSRSDRMKTGSLRGLRE